MAKFQPPKDVDSAHNEWKANCGPAAVAAILGRSVHSVRSAFPGFPAKPWTNVTTMKSALRSLGVEFAVVADKMPDHGLAFLQFNRPELPTRAQYRHTHWIAKSGLAVYDAGVDELMSGPRWDRTIGAELMAHHKADRVYVRYGIEIVHS